MLTHINALPFLYHGVLIVYKLTHRCVVEVGRYCVIFLHKLMYRLKCLQVTFVVLVLLF